MVYNGFMQTSQKPNQIAIIETEVYGVTAYEATCLDCDWHTRRFDRIATARRQAREHGATHFTETKP